MVARQPVTQNGDEIAKFVS